MNRAASLPTELRDRRKLFRATVGVLELLFPETKVPKPPPNLWKPPELVESTVCPAMQEIGQPRNQSQISSHTAQKQIRFVGHVQDYNIRVARIAQALAPLDEALLIAGLPDRDLQQWQDHRTVAAKVLRDPTCVDVASQMLWFVYDCGYMGAFSLTNEETDKKNQNKLNQCQEALDRLRRAVLRIDRTVSPQAVLERLRVSDDRRQITLDGVPYGPFRPDGEGRYLYHLRLGAGDWVSSEDIAELEGRKQIKVAPLKVRLDERFPRLGAIVYLLDGKGSRIVLPLASESGTGR